MSADLNTVKIAIRAVLQSSKHGMSVRQLICDYRELNGTLIPFKVFGFRNIEDFLRSIPDTVSLQNRGGDTIVHYTQCEETAHIEKFVKGQRGPRKKPQRSHAPKPLGHWRQGNQQGPARRATTVPRFSAGTRYAASKPAQGSSIRTGNDWSEWPNQSAVNSSNVYNPRDSIQSQTKKYNNSLPQNDGWSSGSAAVSSETPKTAYTPRPSTSYSGQNAYDRQMVSNPVNNSLSESSRKTTPPRNTHQSPSQVTFDQPIENFSKYIANAIPERTVVFENHNDSIRSSKTVTVKPDLKIATRDTGTVVTKKRDSFSSGSRTTSPSQSFKTLLMDLAQELQLKSPIYKSLGVNDKNSKRIHYLGIVEVDGVKWLSHPSSFPNPDEAEEEAAHKAYDALKLKQNIPKSETFSGEKNKIISNITEILSEEKLNLMFHTGIEEKYQDKYNQKLPLNWLELVESCRDRFDVERKEFTNKVVITVGLAKPSLKKKNSVSSLPSPKPSPMTESAKDFGLTDSQIDTQTMPDSLVLPGTETWDVIVTKVIAANEVIVRLFQNDDQYVELVDQMHSYYTDNPRPVNDVIVGKLYAAKFEETAYRVHVQRVDSDEVTCVFVDEGGEEKLPKSSLHELFPKFLLLPFQAFSCLLADLKYCASSELGRNYLEEMISKVSDSALIAMPTQREDPIEIKLFDTSNPEDKDINEELIQYLKRHYYDDFFKPGVTAEISVLDVSDTGDFKVQIMDKLLHRLEAAQASVNATCNHKLQRIPTLEELSNPSPQCCCYSLFNENWYRAEILEANADGKVKVVYPDYGNEEEVHISNLRLVDASLDPLHFIPYLVSSKCRLDNVPNDPKLKWCKKTTEKYDEIVGTEVVLEMKVIHKATPLIPPRIELFLNVNNDPIVVNMKLAACKEAFEKVDENSEETTRRESLPNIMKPIAAPVANGIKNGHEETDTVTPNVTLRKKSGSESENINIHRLSIHGDDYVVGSNDPIPEPILPSIKPNPVEDEDFFDVFVTLAANPHNFTVTSYTSAKPDSEMSKLMEEMCTFYDSPENIIELNAYMIKRGQYLAVKWKDDRWYRVRVETIVERDPLVVMCYFIDYGDIHVIHSDKIQPLFSQFRKIPMQAMRASLANIVPINGDWEVIACRKFAEMVEQKAFVATVKDIVVENDDRPTLKLVLCDTTGESDFFVNNCSEFHFETNTVTRSNIIKNLKTYLL